MEMKKRINNIKKEQKINSIIWYSLWKMNEMIIDTIIRWIDPIKMYNNKTNINQSNI